MLGPVETRNEKGTLHRVGGSRTGGREGIVKVLLEAGADISRRDNAGATPLTLNLRLANTPILAMLNAADEEGRLAENKTYVNPNVDKNFQAMLTLFKEGLEGSAFLPTKRTVEDLWAEPWLPAAHKGNCFQWIHLPANNMRWVELLLVKLYGKPAKTYHALGSERWVRRQHRGAASKLHTRFMRPLCQSFASVNGQSRGKQGLTDVSPLSDLVLFVPFLHWDVKSLRIARRKALDLPRREPMGDPLLADSELVSAYTNESHHSLQIRRTLDQYYYHTLPDTEKRDDSQVTTRYQQSRKPNTNIVSMVDQLWLWIRRGTNGHPDVVLSCFSSIGGNLAVHPDQYRRADVLGNIKTHLLDDARSVTCAEDLGGLIAAKCSPIYLDPATTLDLSQEHKGVQFSEMYEDAIGDIVSCHRLRCTFSNFRGGITKARLEANQVQFGHNEGMAYCSTMSISTHRKSQE
jgi:hypothetical protein